ncbi:hypothetical protein K470DRAFT_258155 [Piedraia hortae CBS 480.64]|uniref:Pre-mRNA-splicing factor rse1 n=1 Tax=Piedraia hortae CBS 480.64 TaxID=1314780 RepID=A0A6A7BZN8_9PEZI|nr:hypothetical protein K470DRAFT_258155 [Piedraia hortae CBS 480.64]
MSNIQQTQTFYSLTLEAPSAVQSAVTCNAIPRLKRQEQQIFAARGSRLSLYRIIESEDRSEVKVETIVEQDVFATVRAVGAMRVPGTAADQLIVSSDAGGVLVLQYDVEKKAFQRLKWYTYGKSGVRRTIPGQYLACEPRGRCCLYASTEKNKVVFISQRTSTGEIELSSPHEANQWASLCFATCALDVGWDAPVFAALEVDYSDAEADPTGAMYQAREKQLVYYTVDLGLNHVVRSWSDKVDYSANMLFAVPGGQDGPSGVLVCAEGRIYYRHDKADPLSIPIPRRKGWNRTSIIVSGCVHLSRARHDFFFLLQTEEGDVFKLTMDMDVDQNGQETTPKTIHLKYYETLPTAKEMLLIRKGYIYIAAENGNHKLYHVNDLADDLDFEPEHNYSSDEVSADPAEPYKPVYFEPRELTFVRLAVDVPCLHPLMRTRVDNLTGEDAPQIYALQGTGNRSVLKAIRHGVEIQEIVASPLGNIPYDNLWSLKHRHSDDYHSYLLLSSNYGDKTIVLSIGDEVETMSDSPFTTNRATVLAAQMGDATLVQVYARGVRSIMETGTVHEWPSPSQRTIVAASANHRQMLLGLSSGEIAFFFMGDDGVLNQLEEMPEMSGKVTALSVGPTPKGQIQSKFAVVGCDDCSIRVLSIDLDSPLEPRSIQALSAVPTSIEVVDMVDHRSGTTVSHVHIGLQSGLYLRAIIDEVTGDLGDVRTKFLGSLPTRLFPVHVGDGNGVVACSSRPFVGYNHPSSHQFTLTPLLTGQLDAARPFVSEHLTCLCAIQGQNLLIFDVPNIYGRLSSWQLTLKYTPRALARSPSHAMFYIPQSDANTHPSTNAAAEQHVGLVKANGTWASCIQAIDPISQAITCTLDMSDNEAAMCCTVVQFESRNWEPYLAVGTGQNMNSPSAKGFIRIYRISDDGKQLEFVHRTAFNAPIYALMAFRGRLAFGVGNELLVHDIGLKAMLRKSRGIVVPSIITSLDSMGDRIAVGDVRDSVTFVVFKPAHNRMFAFVDDVVQRWTTTTTMVDYETVAGGDKFGNIWLVRCPEQASREADEDGLGGHIANERSYLNGAPYRLDLRAHLYTSDVPTSIQKTSLVAGGQDVLFWSGLQGTLGVLIPFVTRDDVEFFTQLQQLLRTENAPLSGRDHLAYRSYYVPVKAVVDGDLCEQFLNLSNDLKAKIAAECDREVAEVERKVQELRSRVAF